MLGIALGLAASVSWGISDFFGGLQTRRFSALSVLIVSQPVGLVLAYTIALGFADEALPASEFALAAAGGATVVLALGAFYRAMALGSVSVVATIGANATATTVANHTVTIGYDTTFYAFATQVSRTVTEADGQVLTLATSSDYDEGSAHVTE